MNSSTDSQWLPKLNNLVSFRPALSQLQKQRRETAALRDLWLSLGEKRERRLRGLQEKIFPATHVNRTNTLTPPPFALEESSNKRYPEDQKAEEILIQARDKVLASPTDSDEDVASSEVATEEPSTLPAIANASAKSIRAEYAHKPVRPINAIPSLRSRTSQCRRLASQARSTTSQGKRLTSRLQQRGKDTSSRQCRQDDVKSPVPYHTAITRRPERTHSPRFLALTQLCSSPLPHLMPGELSLSAASAAKPGSRRDLREWQEQIVKVVPARPDFAQRLTNGGSPSKVMTFRYPYKVLNIDPACFFYRSYTKVTEKDYVISPEWASEKNPLRIGLATRARTDLSLRHDLKRL